MSNAFVFVKYAKTFIGGLYADLHDLSHIDTNSPDIIAALSPEIEESVARIAFREEDF